MIVRTERVKKMSYKSKDGSVWNGAVPDEKQEYMQCEECGSKKLRMVAHFDGAKMFGYTYNCENGHVILMTMKRDRSWI